MASGTPGRGSGWSACRKTSTRGFDTTGDRCGYGQSGPVFFLTANSGGVTSDVCGRRGHRDLRAAWWVSSARPSSRRRTSAEPRTSCGRAPLAGIDRGDRRCRLASTGRTSPTSTPIGPRHRCSRSPSRRTTSLGVEPGVAHAVSDGLQLHHRPATARDIRDHLVGEGPRRAATDVTATVIVEAPQVVTSDRHRDVIAGEQCCGLVGGSRVRSRGRR